MHSALPAVRLQRIARISATSVVVSTLGAFAAFAGVEHGIGEVRQGWVAPSSLVIQSWPDVAAFDPLNGEPAMTVVPNLAVTGVLAIVVSLAMAAWSLRAMERRRGGFGLIALAFVLLFVGGGFGPPLIGIIAGIAAALAPQPARGNAERVPTAGGQLWPWLLAATVAGYLSLFPGLVLLRAMTGFEASAVVFALTAGSFAALVLTLLTARADDARKAEGPPVEGR